MNEPDLIAPLRAHAEVSPQATALVSADGRTATYADLVEMLDDAAAAFGALGIVPGCRVATVLANAPETAVAILALARVATVVPLNPALTGEELRRTLSRAAISHLLTNAGTSPAAARAAAAADVPLLELQPDAGSLPGRFTIIWPQGRSAHGSTDSAGEPRPVLVLHTSGSTGAPKRVPLTAANLLASSQAIVRSLELTPADRCLNMMPMFHIGAVVDLFLAPLQAGGSVAFTAAISAEAFFDAVKRLDPTWFQAVPTVLSEIVGRSARNGQSGPDLGRLRFVRCVSQPLPASLQSAAEAALGVELVPIYGMSETAGLIAGSPLGGGRPGSVGVAMGPQVLIADQFGNPLPAGQTGEVLVRGPGVMSGYEGGDDTRQTFRGDWLRSGDLGHLDADGYLYLGGRLKDLINRGGEKISPVEIDMAAGEDPTVAEAAAFPVPHPTLGEDVALAVVARQGSAFDSRALTEFLRSRLAPHKLPQRIHVLQSLPRLPSGKLDRRALPGLLEGEARQEAASAPADPLAGELARLWSTVLEIETLALEDNFFAVGGDSLTATQLSMLIEERFGEDIPVGELFMEPTLGDMAAALGKHLAVRAPKPRLADEIRTALRHATISWPGQRREGSLMISRNTIAAGTPFFWVCQSRWQFELLSQCLPAGRPLHVLSSLSNTGLKTDENTSSLALSYADEIAAMTGGKPVLLGGFCQGGVVAFQIARELLRSGSEVSLLCLQDRFIAEPYPGRVALFHGRRGWHCAYDMYDRPERGWRKFYTGPLSSHVYNADHDDLHKLPYVEQFARDLEDEMERAEHGRPVARPVAEGRAKAIDPRSCAARIIARVPRFLRQGQRRAIDVKVTNTSPVAWEATSSSGIILAARWFGDDPWNSVTLDGRAELARAVAPGETVVLRLEIHMPMRGTPQRIQIDLVEDGLKWFADDGRSGLTKTVLPLPPRWPL